VFIRVKAGILAGKVKKLETGREHGALTAIRGNVQYSPDGGVSSSFESGAGRQNPQVKVDLVVAGGLRRLW